MNLNKFIGIKHYFGESSFTKCDCAGLARLFYKEHNYGIDLTDGKPLDEAEYKHQPYRMLRYLLKSLDKVRSIDELKYGDIVVVRIMEELHIGIYTEYQRLLTMEVPVVIGHTQSCIYKGYQWMSYFICGFRRKQ